MPEAVPVPPPLPLPPELEQRIEGLPTLPLADLRETYATTFGRESPINNRRFLERRLAYHWQAVEYEKAYPGVLANLRARIDALSQALEASEAASHGVAAKLPPGTVLVRGFAGTDHEVRVIGPDSFEYAGKRYASLTRVAREITGTHWSGPTFFGLTKRRQRDRR